MFNHADFTAPEAPSSPDQTALKVQPERKFGRKLSVVIGVVAAIIIVTVALLIPQGAATIPLFVNYEVGEKMVYNTSFTMTFDTGNTPISTGLTGALQNNTGVNSTSSIEVVGFDGEFYTLNNTSTIILNQKSTSFSYLSKMNKTGFSTFILNLGSQGTQVSANTSIGNPYLTGLLDRPEVKVGDTWEVPLPLKNSSGMQVTGGLTMTFGGFEDLTVPAGTYRVFKVDMASHDLNMHFSPQGENYGYNMAMTLNGQMYTEYGTMRQIKSIVQETVNYESAMINYSMSISMGMTLIQHIKP